MITFTVSFDSIRITETRSQHNDTDYVAVTLLLKSATATGTTQSLRKSLGDVNNGTTPIGLSFPNVHIDPSQTLIFNYLVINIGKLWESENTIESRLLTVGAALAEMGLVTGGTQIQTSTYPGIGSMLASASWWLDHEVNTIVDHLGCDGLVALEQVTLTYSDLLAKTAGGTYQHETPHPGTQSTVGCGRNSMYYVDWHVSKAVTIPTGPIKGGPIITGPVL